MSDNISNTQKNNLPQTDYQELPNPEEFANGLKALKAYFPDTLEHVTEDNLCQQFRFDFYETIHPNMCEDTKKLLDKDFFTKGVAGREPQNLELTANDSDLSLYEKSDQHELTCVTSLKQYTGDIRKDLGMEQAEKAYVPGSTTHTYYIDKMFTVCHKEEFNEKHEKIRDCFSTDTNEDRGFKTADGGLISHQYKKSDAVINQCFDAPPDNQAIPNQRNKLETHLRITI